MTEIDVEAERRLKDSWALKQGCISEDDFAKLKNQLRNAHLIMTGDYNITVYIDEAADHPSGVYRIAGHPGLDALTAFRFEGPLPTATSMCSEVVAQLENAPG